jgi:quinolinate synthase
MADAHGSTAQIIQYVQHAPAGSTIFVGTEAHLVRRLAEEHKDRLTVRVLKSSICPNMAKTNEQNLFTLLRDWPDWAVIRVPPAAITDARLCLERMLRV